MTAIEMVELAAAVAILAAGVWLYRRRDKADTYGSQGAVLLFVIAVIMGVHALGLMEYRPSATEIEAAQSR